MRVKRFIGESVSDTMSKIKRELGPEAVILQTRQVKEGGFLGFFTKTKVEITAAIEDKPSSGEIGLSENNYVVKSDEIRRAYEAYRMKETEKEKEYKEEKTDWNQGDSIKPTIAEDTSTELKEMHTILKEIKGHITRQEDKVSVPEPLDKWLKFLTQRGIGEELANGIINSIREKLAQEYWNNKELVYDRIRQHVMSSCLNIEIIRPKKNRSTVVALVGPTGVGKTTTIGKLAAGFSIIERRKVALITADTYRVAAVEQLKTFGEIIGVPVEVVMTPGSLQEAVDRHKDKELVFIDTAGRSPHHDLHMSELEAFLEKGKPDLTMLVLSVTTNLADQILVFERFKTLSSHLILTKLDESSRNGSLLDLISKANLPVAYLTNGQNVPDDIDAATPEKLAACILGEGRPNV